MNKFELLEMFPEASDITYTVKESDFYSSFLIRDIHCGYREDTACCSNKHGCKQGGYSIDVLSAIKTAVAKKLTEYDGTPINCKGYTGYNANKNKIPCNYRVDVKINVKYKDS
jgi:hypothetical protein